MRKNDLSVFKMEKQGFKITLKKGTDFLPVISSVSPSHPPAPVTTNSTPSPEVTPVAKELPLREIASPTVGTFYASQTADGPPCVTVGQEVTEDTIVCIIESMKVMNEIKAEMRGVIVEVVAENGKTVEYNQPLFRIR